MTSKTSHDVLGVRPNASSAEIELAYKGRRTQYHPDKYQGSDADTLRWATQMMQEVNAAYAALTNNHQGREQEARQQAAAAASNGPTPVTDTLPTLAAELQSFCSRYGSSSRAYFAPNIPLKKISGALQSYGEGLDPAEVLAVIDTTVFGGAKEGMLLTELEVRVKSMGSSCCYWKWQGIHQIGVSGSDFYINSRKAGDCTMADPEELVPLFLFIQSHLDRLKAIKPSRNANARSQSVKAEEHLVELRDCIELFGTAKARLLDLCEMIAPLEQRLGHDLIDRDDAVNYFEMLEECMRDSGARHFAFMTLGQIAVLSQCAVSYRSDPEGEVPTVLLQDNDEDSRLLAELRMVLRSMVEAREGATQQARTSEFFRR